MHSSARIGLGMTVFLLSVSVHAASFPDTQMTRYRDAYIALSERGVIEGYDNGLGRPSATLNRAEALKVLVLARPELRKRAKWFSRHMPQLSLFADVDQRSWYAPSVETAFEAGIITGYADRTLKPGGTLTVEESVVLLMRAYGEKTGSRPGSQDDWFQPSIESAVRRNLIAREESVFIGDRITRGQFFDMIYRFDVVRGQKIAAFVERDGSTQRPPIARRPSGVPVPSASNGFAVSIPALGIDSLPVFHPADSFTSKGLLAPLKNGVGHLFGYPGGGTKIMVYGHSSGYAWDVSQYTKIFRRVNELKAGDRVTVTYKDRLYTYEVTHQQEISPTDIRPFTGDGEELILYTCWPPDSIKKRLIVHSKPVDVVVLR